MVLKICSIGQCSVARVSTIKVSLFLVNVCVIVVVVVFEYIVRLPDIVFIFCICTSYCEIVEFLFTQCIDDFTRSEV